MRILKLIKPLIVLYAPGLVKKLAKKSDGKKTVTGIILTAAGVSMALIPETQHVAMEALAVGVPILITGIIHKIKKRRQR